MPGPSSHARPILAAVLAASLLGLGLACGGKGDSGGSGDPFANLKVYLASGPYASLLVECVTIEYVSESCELSRLPLIGMVDTNPDVDTIMDRVVVSHDWMGVRFRQALQSLDPDILLLLRSVTAIVIDDDINPSFYEPATGAIYLDPYYLWQSVPEKRTISLEEDYRAGFGRDLGFLPAFRYVDNDDLAWFWYDLTDNLERTTPDLIHALASLLYHELAHANAVFPATEIALISPVRTVFDAAFNPSYTPVDEQLEASMPLASSELEGIAEVRYKGRTATPAERVMTAAQAGVYFEADGANDEYGYTSYQEDLAMLFEETMLRYHYGFERDFAFLPAVANPTSCDSYIVAWGTRGRVGHANVKSRAQFVSDRLLPSLDLSGFYAGLSAPDALRHVGWCNSVVLMSPPGHGRTGKALPGMRDDGGWLHSKRRYE